MKAMHCYVSFRFLLGEGWGWGGCETIPTLTGTAIPQPEALYYNQKLDPTTTDQLFALFGHSYKVGDVFREL